MTILEKINHAYQTYYRDTGVRPTRIYVGAFDFRELRMEIGTMFVTFKVGDERPQNQVMGLEVFPVALDSHFYVC